MRFTPVFLFFFLAAACSRPPAPASAPHETENWQAREFAAEHAFFLRAANQPDRGIDVTGYDVKGHFDWDKQRLFAQVEVSLTVTAEHLDAVVLDNRTAVRAVQNAGGPLAFHADGDTLSVSLPGNRGDVLKFTIVYEAAANRLPNGEQSALIAIAPRAGDPVNARVVATLSEPVSAIDWLPCHNDPSDRATFAIELTMPEDETLIANGDLHKNDVTDGVRTMAYSTAFTLPNYLMAFSVGQFARYAGLHGRNTVGIWARKGLPLDVPAVLSNLNRAMGAYEKLLGNYPFDSYVIVLLPEYHGGVEHAGITFQGEAQSTRGDLAADYELMAHEMGHQWFGDLVTVHSWDDLWIKEGMATLLSAEASRFLLDENGAGELGGAAFDLTDGDRIRDTSLSPNQKYTSGPYGRSAWTLTQVRALIGEDKFWAALRSILQDYAFGSVSTEQFLAHFEPALGKEKTDRWRAALAAQKLPRVRDEQGSLGQHTWSVEDPDGALLSPLEFRWLDDSENIANVALTPERPFSWSDSDSRLLMIEPRNVTPVTALPGWEKAVEESGIGKLLVARTERQRSEFSDLPGPVQSYALEWGDGWQLDPATFGKLLSGLASEEAKYAGLQVGCKLAKEATSVNSGAAWKNAIGSALARPPFLGLPATAEHHGLADCRATIGEDFLESTWAGMTAAPSDKKWNETILTFTLLFSSTPDRIFPVASALAQNAPSVRARRQALQQIARHLDGTYAKPEATALPQWTAFLRQELQSVTAIEMLQPIMKALASANDRQAVPVLSAVIPKWIDGGAQVQGVCTAKKLTDKDTPAWDAFRAGLGDTKQFSFSVRKLLEQPGGCE